MEHRDRNARRRVVASGGNAYLLRGMGSLRTLAGPRPMTGIALEARGETAAGRRVRTRGAAVLIASLTAALLVAHYVWLRRFRQAFVGAGGESGSMQFALSNFDALRDYGPWTFVKTVAGRGGYGP